MREKMRKIFRLHSEETSEKTHQPAFTVKVGQYALCATTKAEIQHTLLIMCLLHWIK